VIHHPEALCTAVQQFTFGKQSVKEKKKGKKENEVLTCVGNHAMKDKNCEI
jgi:hypothetical protein